jgi:uncharacterized protein
MAVGHMIDTEGRGRPTGGGGGASRPDRGTNAPADLRFPVRIDRTWRAVMRDGVELAMVVVRPDAPGRFPAIVSYGPYRTLTAIKATYSDAEYNHRWDGPSWFAERGYAVVAFDVRGTGNSGGVTQDIYSEDERRDGAEMVEWIARQPWCDGNVGMWGMSYGGVVQWQVAVQQPPHLRTLVVGSANDSVYDDWVYPGGTIRPYMFDTFSPLMTASNFAPPDPEIAGDGWRALWQERLDANVPWGIAFLEHGLDDDYWQGRSLAPDYGRVRVPVMLWSGWADCYPTPILRAYSRLNVPKKVVVGPWGHDWPESAVPGPRIAFREILLRWFDHWLRGRDTGIMDEPPVTLWVRRYTVPDERMRIDDAGEWRAELAWPPEGTRPVTYFLNDAGRCGPSPDPEAGSDSYPYDPTVGVAAGIHWGGGVIPLAMPLDQWPDEAKSLTFTTSPLDDDTELIGEPRAVLHVSSTADRAYLHVTIADVAPDGTSKLVTEGGVLSSHATSDEGLEPLGEGEIRALTIGLKAMSYTVQCGHRIRVSVSSADLQNAWPAAPSAVHTLHRGGDRPSHVVLPFAAPRDRGLEPTNMPPSPHREPEPQDFKGCRHAVMANAVDDRVIVELDRESGLLPISGPASTIYGESESRRHASSRYVVSRASPATTELTADHVYTISRPDREIRIAAHEVLASDEVAFQFSSRVDIEVDGERAWSNSWHAMRPRLAD